MTFERYEKRILRTQLYIEDHLDDDLSLETLARVAQTSPFHFHRIFKGFVGETLADYVRRVRLEKASMSLKHTERSVTDIAFDSGYKTHEAFTRAFQRRFGLSPSQFREGQIPTRNYQKEMRFMDTKTRDVRIEEIQEIHVAALRHVGPYEEAGPVFGRLMEWAGQNQLFRADTKILGICHDDPSVTEAAKIRFDCCVSVEQSFQDRDGFVKQTIAGGRYAVLTHKGPYEELAPSYDWFFSTWLPDSKEQVRDLPIFELYLNDPSNTPPEELLTEIHMPV